MIEKHLLKELTILYVEDDIAIREGIDKILSSVVGEVVLAGNGLEGLELYKKHKHIDLIVTDINMPKMDGLTMCQKIREMDISIPVVVTTAHNEMDFLSQAIEAGVSSYLMKPVDAYKLVQDIMRISEPLFLKRELEVMNDSLEQRVADAIAQNIQKDILIQEIVEFQNNMIVVFDKHCVPLFANKSFLKVIHVENLEDMLKKYQNFESIMIDNEDYFHPSAFNNDKNWLENLLSVDPKNRVIAILEIDTFEPKAYLVNLYYNENSEHWICNFSEFTQIAVEKSMYKHKAYTDELTQINNRAKFNLEFTRELQTSSKISDYALSVLIFDIDHFKKFNDTYGHDIGDKILMQLTEMLALKVRNRDIFARWGGEEFVILLPVTKLEEAQKVAEHLRQAIEEHLFYNNLKVTC
ncbi:MAG: diguanylate cyclase, partial [Campylobacterota bacterium]|nr:diguanylate cyclase [Campylobacterota bacterium]